ncbi:MAG: metallophosphoesterase family protein [Planctomycetota bacterium]
MRIGLVSDTHGKLSRLQDALEILTSRLIDAIVHCGDIDNPECLEMMAATGLPVYAVAGNVDRHIQDLKDTAERTGVDFHSQIVAVPLGDGRHLAATHGHDSRILAELTGGGQFPYVCHGHTHRVRDENHNGVRVICPGALRQPRSPRHPTAAILDTERDELTLIDVPK